MKTRIVAMDLRPVATALIIAALIMAVMVVPAEAGDGHLSLDVETSRVAGATRYETAVAIASEAFPGWAGVTHVVVAAGDTGLSDALSASGLCWAYEAPLLLVTADAVPAPVLGALREIVAANGPVDVLIVGGEARVGAGATVQMEAIVGQGRVSRVSGANRYETARAVAYEMELGAASRGATLPGVAILANGESEARFPDSLVLSAVSARIGAPLLLVRSGAVSEATLGTLDDLGLDERFVAGGSAAVEQSVVDALGAQRWAGSDRYGTAAAVASGALEQGWLDPDEVFLAAGVPDALTGATLSARTGGVLLLTAKTGLPRSTADHFDDTAGITDVTLLGGTGVVSDSIIGQLAGGPGAPTLMAGISGTDKCGPKLPVRVFSGVNTRFVRIFRNGTLLTERTVSPYEVVDLGTLDTELGTNRFEVQAVSHDGSVQSSSQSFMHLGYSWDTYIVVDKSDFRLYWVQGGVLKEIHVVAHGRNNRTPEGVFRIDAKYYSDPAGVYGPRKMRLYKQIAPGRFSFTPYLIHGTNQPWVMGTQASAGCIRMLNEEVLKLWPQVPLRTMAVVRP